MSWSSRVDKQDSGVRLSWWFLLATPILETGSCSEVVVDKQWTHLLRDKLEEVQSLSVVLSLRIWWTGETRITEEDSLMFEDQMWSSDCGLCLQHFFLSFHHINSILKQLSPWYDRGILTRLPDQVHTDGVSVRQAGLSDQSLVLS